MWWTILTIVVVVSVYWWWWDASNSRRVREHTNREKQTVGGAPISTEIGKS